jgi:EmrB/QacA subfamily drug resistance transporter
LPEETVSVRDRLVLFTLAAAQLLVILDTTIVNIAVPQAQVDLHMSDELRQWVITGYALAFGAVLLIGGRVADFWGRKRTFLLGLALFGAASAWGGLATFGVELIGARVLQGASAALMAPASLSLVSVTFPSGRPRNLAFGLLGGIVSSGAAVGLILGGVLTEWTSWRWCLLVNVPIVIAALIAAVPVLRESRASGRARYDVAGAVTVALGFAALVYGLTRAEAGWIEGGALLFVAVGVVLLAAFVIIQHRSSAPLLPLRVILHRARGGALLVQACSGSVVVGMTLYLTFHLQQVLHFSPLASGLATLPFAIAIAATIPLLVRFIPRTGPKPLLIGGPLVAAVGLVLLSRVTADGSYWTQVLPGLVVMGVGMAGIFVPAQNVALAGVDEHDAGAAAAASNAANQIGGSIGLAVLTNLYLATTAGDTAPTALVDGYSAVFLASAGLLVVAACIAAFVITFRSRDGAPTPAPADHAAPIL